MTTPDVMTAAEHYREAGRLLQESKERLSLHPESQNLALIALTHAVLALVDVTAEAGGL